METVKLDDRDFIECEILDEGYNCQALRPRGPPWNEWNSVHKDFKRVFSISGEGDMKTTVKSRFSQRKRMGEAAVEKRVITLKPLIESEHREVASFTCQFDPGRKLDCKNSGIV